MLEKIFKLKQNNTTVKTEILAGLTTFMTMAYIIALNPNLLTGFGAEGTKALWNGVFLATCIASAVGMFVMAFLANKPFALAPGMGLNSFFAVVVANIVSITGLSYVDSFQAALCIILIEGILFFILSIFNIRDKIVDAIPYGVRMGIFVCRMGGWMAFDRAVGGCGGCRRTESRGIACERRADAVYSSPAS